jgi:hypothetical protein
MEQVFAGIKAAGQSLIDSLEKIGNAIVKLFKFDFSGAIADIKSVVKEAGDAYGAMAKLTEEAQKLHKEQLANDLDQAERAKKLAILREQATDETVTVAKRKAALLELKKDAEQNSKDDIDLAKRTTDNKIKQLTIQKDGAKKNQDEINKLKIEQINVETQNANELRRISKQITSIDKSEEAERKKIQDESNANTKKYLEVKNKLQNDANLSAITNEVLLNIQKAKNQEQDKIREIDSLKVSEDKKAELRLMVHKSSLNEIAKINETAYEKAKKREEEIAKEIALEQKKKDEDFIKKIDEDQKKQDEAEDKAIKASIKNKNDQAKLTKDISEGGMSKEELELFKLEETYQKKLAIAAGNEALITAVTKENEDAKTEIKRNAANAQLNESTKASEALIGVLGKETAVGKGLGIANALINTYQGATDALRAKSTLPSPFDVVAKIANVAAVLASGFKAVKAITAVQVPGAGGGGGTPSVPTPITPQQISTQLNSASIQGVGNAANSGAGRSFVLDTDIKDNQERQARINRAARLG